MLLLFSFRKSDVERFYGGLFHDRKHLDALERLERKNRDRSMWRQGIRNIKALDNLPGDGDACCVT